MQGGGHAGMEAAVPRAPAHTSLCCTAACPTPILLPIIWPPLPPPGLPVHQPVPTMSDDHRKEAVEGWLTFLPHCTEEPSMSGPGRSSSQRAWALLGRGWKTQMWPQCTGWQTCHSLRWLSPAGLDAFTPAVGSLHPCTFGGILTHPVLLRDSG